MVNIFSPVTRSAWKMRILYILLTLAGVLMMASSQIYSRGLIPGEIEACILSSSPDSWKIDIDLEQHAALQNRPLPLNEAVAGALRQVSLLPQERRTNMLRQGALLSIMAILGLIRECAVARRRKQFEQQSAR